MLTDCCLSVFRSLSKKKCIDGAGAGTNISERRAARAHALVQLGELSAGRVALEAAELAPGTEETYRALTDPRRRPPRPREPISDHLLNMSPALFELDEDRFARSARKGAAPGPSGMVVEHLRCWTIPEMRTCFS